MPSDLALSFWVSFGAAAVASYPILGLLRRLRAESIISRFAPETHQSKQGTPSMGGIITLFGCSVAFIAMLARGKGDGIGAAVWLLFAFAFVGLLDDFVVPRLTGKRGIGWMPKLALQLIAVSPLFFYMPLADAVGVAFWVLFFANAVNFADGLDGLAASLLLLTLPVLALLLGWSAESAVALAVCGGLLPFLFLNAPPARVFMGDVGALSFGATYGYLFAHAEWQRSVAPWALSLVFILELVLVPIQIGAVKTIGRRVFPATPIHHAFEMRGWPESRVVWAFLIAQVALSALVLTGVLS